MEILKVPYETGVIRIDFGMDFDDDRKGVTGAVELDIENQAYFVDMINTLFDENPEPLSLLVDLRNVTYIDSSGLWALFEGHKKASQKNGKMVLVNPTKDVKRVLDITKMSSKLQIFNDLDLALSSIR